MIIQVIIVHNVLKVIMLIKMKVVKFSHKVLKIVKFILMKLLVQNVNHIFIYKIMFVMRFLMMLKFLIVFIMILLIHVLNVI